MAGAALVCASSFLIVYLEQRSSGRDGGSRGGGGRQAALEAAPLQLKRSDGGEIALEVIAVAGWQRPHGSSGRQAGQEGGLAAAWEK